MWSAWGSAFAAGGCDSGGDLLALGAFGFGDHFGGAWDPEGQQVRVHEQGARPRGRMNEVRPLLRLKRFTTFADGNVSTCVRDSPARDTHAKLDLPQLSRLIGSLPHTRWLRGDLDDWTSGTSTSESTTRLSPRDLSVPTDRTGPSMLPEQTIYSFRYDRFHCSHKCIGPYCNPQSPQFVSRLWPAKPPSSIHLG
jgi:hypothetical protein